MINETILKTESDSNIWFAPFLRQWQKSYSGWTVAFFSALTGCFVLYQIFGSDIEKQTALVADLMQAVISVAVVWLTWRVTRHPAIDADSRKAWRIVTASYLAYSFGHCLWFHYSSILGIEPFPSIADLGFWLFYPLMLWALLSFPAGETNRSERLKFVMDIAIVMLGGATAVWHFVIRPTIEKSADGEILMTFLNLSYVVGDLVLLLGIVTILLRRPIRINRIALFTIVFGLLNILVADIGFAYFTMLGTYTAGHWIDNFFITGLLVFLFAAHYQYQHLSQMTIAENAEENKLQVQKFSWLPYLAIASAFGILLLETRNHWTDWLGIIVFISIIMTGLVVIRQITAVKENLRLQEENVVRISELRFKSLVENSSDLITIRNREGKVVFRSPSAKHILGYETDEIDKLSSFELIHPDDTKALQKSYQLLESGELDIYKNEYRVKHKDGSWRVMEGIAKTFDDNENDWHGVIVNSRDITKRKQDEVRLRIYTSKLEKSNRELQDFAYVASHDLQEPLRKVQAFGDRLQKKCADSLSEEGSDYIHRMRDAAGRMQSLINDLLTFSRITSKAQPFQSVDIREIANEVISDLEVRIEQTNGKVEIGDLPVIDADPVQMRQLLQNLIGNALKFHRPEDSPVIKIYAEKTSPNTNAAEVKGREVQGIGNGIQFCKFVVEDNGIGFDEKYLDRIFTVFQRLHGRSEYEGSGIGLAVCRKIAERHGGTITAKSEPDQGSTFFVTLPFTQIEKEINENE